MNRFCAALSAACLASLISLPPQVEATPATTAPAVASDPKAQASFQFALGKMLNAEGSLLEALAAFKEAERLDPDAPYIHVELAQTLERLAEASRAPSTRSDYLRQAGEQITRARSLAPGDLDVLRVAGLIYLSLAAQDPASLKTAQEVLEQVRARDPSDVQTNVALGRIYLDQGQPDKAVDVFRELVRNIPQQRAGYAFLVEALLQAKREKEAEGVLQEMLGFDPGSLEARLTLADLQERRGDHRTAAETLKAAPESVLADPRLRRQLAWTLYLAGDLEGAFHVVEPLLTGGEDAENRSMATLKGMILSAEGKNTEALALLEGLYRAHPTEVSLAANVARLLEREGRRAEAAKVLTDLTEALADEGKNEAAREVRLELVRSYLGAKEWEKASEAVAPLLTNDDEWIRSQARSLEADSLIGRQRYDEALALLGARDSSTSDIAKRAEVLFKAGKEAEGRRQLEELAKSGRPDAVLAAAQSYHRAEKYEESIAMLRRLLEQRADLVPAAFLLGAAYERTGRRPEAMTQFRRVLELDPDFHAALNYLGYMYAEKGENLDEALSLIRRAVALDPDNGAYVDSLGWTFFQLGRPEQARGYLERAIRLDPEDATVHEHLGDVYVALGQTEKAREVYRRALELGDENGDQVRRKLDGLGSPPRR